MVRTNPEGRTLQESMDRCTSRRDITEIPSKMAFNTVQSVDQSFNPFPNKPWF